MNRTRIKMGVGENLKRRTELLDFVVISQPSASFSGCDLPHAIRMYEIQFF